MCLTNLLVGRAKEKFSHNLLIVKLTIFFPIQFELMTLSRRALRYRSRYHEILNKPTRLTKWILNMTKDNSLLIPRGKLRLDFHKKAYL